MTMTPREALRTALERISGLDAAAFPDRDLADFERDIEACGYAVVPLEAIADMQDAGVIEMGFRPNDAAYAATVFHRIYRAAISARPRVGGE